MLSAQEVDEMDERQYKWFVFDMLQKGNKKMDRASVERKKFVDEIVKVRQDHCDLTEVVISHCEDKKVHTPSNGNPQPIKEWLLDWRVIISIAVAIGIIVSTIITNI